MSDLRFIAINVRALDLRFIAAGFFRSFCLFRPVADVSGREREREGRREREIERERDKHSKTELRVERERGGRGFVRRDRERGSK